VIDEVVVRQATAGDRREILALLERALGWRDDDRHAALFEWKHGQNVFGPSPAWVAEQDGRLVGFRTFLRWEFVRGHVAIRAVRAVDTATDPDQQRHGIFKRLTLCALAEIRQDAEFVFNTPNDRSRPGYLSMGWTEVGRIPLAARPVAPAGVIRMAGARAPAGLWSAEGAGGEPAAALLESDAAISEVLRSQPLPHAMATRRSVAYLRWRYGFSPLDYRAVVAAGDPAAGLALFRVRERGTAREATLCEVLVPEGHPATARRLVRDVARAAGADYLLRVAASRDGCVPLPRQGPVLTWRPLGEPGRHARRDWDLTLGDVELF
jgi:GNAT superfamily N-acetyltransferase